MEGADAVALSREAEAGLRLVAKGLSDAALTELARGVFAVLGRAGGVTEDTILGSSSLSDTPKADAKAVYSSLSTYVVECVRTEATAETVGTGLTERGWSTERAKAVVTLYRTSAPRLADLVANTGVSLGKVVDLEWRLDYQVQSSGVGKTHKPQYFIKLKTMALPSGDDAGEGELRDVEFTATLQQLQDMLTRLKEASSAVEGMVGGFDEPAGSSGRGGRGGAGGGSRKK